MLFCNTTLTIEICSKSILLLGNRSIFSPQFFWIEILGCEMERRHAILALLALLLVASNPMAGAVPEQRSHNEQPDAAAMAKQVKEIASQVWEVVSPWVQWAKAAGRDVVAVVYEKASFQGLKSVAAEASRIGYNFFTGKPYQAAYQVAKDVPVAGSAVKDVIGEANLRKHAARERVEEEKEL